MQDTSKPTELTYHKYVTNNKDILKKNNQCACIYCLKMFQSNEIIEWCDNGQTALCPYCSIDTVVSYDAIQYTEDTLKEWHSEGFSNN